MVMPAVASATRRKDRGVRFDVAPHGHGRSMWTAEEFEALTPSERDEAFDAAVVLDLDAIPSELLERVRTRLQERIEKHQPGGSSPGSAHRPMGRVGPAHGGRSGARRC